MADNHTLTAVVMTATAPASITDPSGTTVDAPTLADVHRILAKSAQLGAGTLRVRVTDPSGDTQFRVGDDGTIVQTDVQDPAQWLLVFGPWTATTPGQRPYRVANVAMLEQDAQALSSRTRQPVTLEVHTLTTTGDNLPTHTYMPQPYELPSLQDPTSERTDKMPEPTQERSVPQPPKPLQAPRKTPPTPTPAPAPTSDAAVLRPYGLDNAFTVLGHDHDLDLDGKLDTSPARKRFGGFINHIGFKTAPGRTESAQRREAAELLQCEQIIRQATWGRGSVGFTVANKKGTAGKTPLIVSVCAMIASIRGGSVAMQEVSDDPGQLAGRSEGEPRRGIGELIANAEQIATKAQLEGYAVPQTSFTHSFGSSPNRRAPLNREAVLTVAALIDRFYTIRAMDSGNVYTSSAFAGAMESSDALLIPTMNASDSMSEAVELFRFLESHENPHFRELAVRAIVVRISDGRPEYKVERMVKDFMHQTGITPDRMFALPYDAHIAERGPITLAKLAPATKNALLRISAALITQLQDAVNDD